MKESSKFYSSLGLLIILNVIIKPLWIFGIDRQVQNAVSTEAYGTYFSLLNFSIVFSFLLDWGLTAFFNRQLAANHENFIDKAGSFLFIKLIFAFIYAAIVFGVAYITGIRQWNILAGVIAIQVLISLFVFLRSIITAQQWFSTEAWLSVLDKGLMILLCGSFIYFPSFLGAITLERFLQAQISSTLLAISVVLIILIKRGVKLTFGNSLPGRQTLHSALPFAIIVLLMSVHYRLDGFLLERIHTNGAYEAGLYAEAYRLLDASNMAGYLLASFLLPFIARQWSRGNNTDGAILNSRHLLIIFSLLIASTTVFLAPWIQQLLYHNTDIVATEILQWCLPALIGYSLVQVYGTVMTATGQVLPFCYIIFLAVVLNIVLNLLLIPGYGAKGCCIAALISQGFCGITAMVYVQKKLGINIHLRSLLMYIFIGIILCGFYYLFRDINISRWLLIAGAGLITLTAAIIFKLVDINKWRNIIKRDNL